MAGYISKDELQKQGELMYDPKAECEADATSFVVRMNYINSMQPADVVDRSMYEQLYEESNAFSKAYLKEREKYKQLKLNIDKSVEEIEQYLLEEECNGNHEKGILFALEILERNGVYKRNTGEIK